MSIPHLPQEILDYVVDPLNGYPKALKECCLVSKSWIPRTRKHLFAEIRLHTKKRLESWKKTFPDPSTSPARHTKVLFVGCAHAVTATDAGEGGWLRGFSRVVRLGVSSQLLDPGLPDIFTPFHGLSPVVKSLRLTSRPFVPSHIFDLALSFPVLEDLAVSTNFGALTDRWDSSDGPLTIAQPPSSPAFTGSLDIFLRGGMGPIVHLLFPLPGGIHFRKFTLRWFKKGDPLLTTRWLERCSRTIKSLDIASHLGTPVRHGVRSGNLPLFPVGSRSASTDLSKALKLEDVDFRLRSLSIAWVTAALRTITPQHRDLRRISIHLPRSLAFLDAAESVRQLIGEEGVGHWSDLDHHLAQFWESRSITPEVVLTAAKGNTQGARVCVGLLLPGVTTRGMIDLVD